MALRFEQLIERYHDEIYRYLWRLLGSARDADGASGVEDLVQEVFLRAFRHFPRLRINSNHRAWLYKIATNRGLSKLRRLSRDRARFNHFATEPGLHERHTADSPAGGNARRLRVLLETLPSRQRTCLTLRYLEDMDYPEIARIAGCSQESARASVYRAIRQLRKVMKEDK